MEKYFGVFVLALVVLIFSCKREKELPPDCSECGKKVEKVENRQGSITFDQKTGRYLMYTHILGTIDAFRADFLCDLPKEYQKVGKKIVVSGTAYETTLRFQPGICCVDENYCLTLSSITEQ